MFSEWIIDNASWIAASWQIDNNIWAIAWDKSTERVETGTFEWAPLNKIPRYLSKEQCFVKHNIHGEGFAMSVKEKGTNPILSVMFKNGLIDVSLESLTKQVPKYEVKKLDTSIKRIMLIKFKDDCRLLNFKENNKEYILEHDISADKTTVNELVKVSAIQDDMYQIIKSDAAWRNKTASEKQINALKFMYKNIDMARLTSGEASMLMEQKKWMNTIKNLTEKYLQ